ncbi:DNA (cytosine-5)-methyltransferase 1 [Tissierella praeacuta DSM 18095]|uniref:Cytosine-specific methyltransferase n=1 Tax=Tissierella praeacuta DSM 18095 TaxID=1123404 RepID=A0A1M4X9X4_9FIRM|nr:DNA (cytosine-5-)-methyltransferase [Tissierella praeacuta]SHE90308.1 DNA (cytosine-5)-methyltransferase 1 [Tissierella praeacuta DSM 18095]SUP02563.1 Modification methylase HpaII [Tissierella praeacuta]
MYRTVDLFAGIGGIRRGFEMTGFFKNVLSAENDKFACETYKHIFGENPQNDVTTEEFKTLIQKTEYETLLAGFPCQSFSRAGKQEGFKDSTRGTLFFHIADIIEKTRPRTFLLENVDNLLSHDKGNTFKVIIETLVNELGYKIIGVEKNLIGELIFDNKSFIRNSRNFGIPQNRPRVYIMGFDERYYGDAVHKLPIEQLPLERKRGPIYENLNSLLEFNAPAEYYVAQGYLDTLKKHRQRHEGKGNGFGYMVVNEPHIENPYSNAILATGGSGKERNLVFDPQDGIAGTIIKNKQTPLNNEGIRHMTPREWAKLQGFIGYAFVDEEGIDKFTMPPNISNTQLYKQFGNSVTIPVIEEMALYMSECIQFLENQLKESKKYEQAI